MLLRPAHWFWGDDRISSSIPKSGRPDVVVITLDTVRPDSLTTPEAQALPRWRSSLLRAVRTDSTKVVQDLEGRVVTYHLSKSGEDVVPAGRSQQLLVELARFSIRLPPSAERGTLHLPNDVRERLRALGYIR